MNHVNNTSTLDSHHPFIWGDVHTTGIQAFDHDHHLISVALGILENCLSLGMRCDVFHRTVGFISEHANRHFLREELVMDRLGYPQLAQHEVEHSRMRRWMSANMPNLAALPEAKIRARMDYLHDWWSGHTRGQDAAYSAFLMPHALEARAIAAKYNLN